MNEVRSRADTAGRNSRVRIVPQNDKIRFGCSVFVCDDMQEKCAKREIHKCRCSQSLGVDELLGDVEGSGSAINLGDREGEQWEMNEHS